MNPEIDAWTQRYQTALRRYLRTDTAANPPSALRLGRQGVTIGIETLDVVRIHEQAVKALMAPDSECVGAQQTIGRARVFFTATIVPIAKSHGAARQADAHEKRLTRALRLRTQAVRTSRRQVDRSVVRRKAAEAVLETSAKSRTKLLAESCLLQKRLRHLTHEMLAAQEKECRKTSRQLCDEVAQSLLAINLKLLTLGMATQAKSQNLKKEIDETRRLVLKSATLVSGLSHEGERDHEA